MSERKPAGEIPADARKLAVAWARHELGPERQIIGARAVPFDGGAIYHFRTDGHPAVRLELVVNDDGSFQGPKRIGAHERRRQAAAVRRIEGDLVAPRTRYMDDQRKRWGWR